MRRSSDHHSDSSGSALPLAGHSSPLDSATSPSSYSSSEARFRFLQLGSGTPSLLTWNIYEYEGHVADRQTWMRFKIHDTDAGGLVPDNIKKIYDPNIAFIQGGGVISPFGITQLAVEMERDRMPVTDQAGRVSHYAYGNPRRVVHLEGVILDHAVPASGYQAPRGEELLKLKLKIPDYKPPPEPEGPRQLRERKRRRALRRKKR